MKYYQICSNGVTDTSDSRITFNANGVCDHYNTFYTKVLPNWHTDARGEIELCEMVRKIKSSGQGKDFDCIIGIIGAAGSLFVFKWAYRAILINYPSRADKDALFYRHCNYPS